MKDGTSGVVTVPTTDGAVNCDGPVCVQRVDSVRYRLALDIPAGFNNGSLDYPLSLMCWGTSIGDNDPQSPAWGNGVRSTSTDHNGHCTGGVQAPCVNVDVYGEASSHESYGAVCLDPEA